MTQLRQRFIEDLQLQGKSARTQQADVRAVRQLAEHFNTPRRAPARPSTGSKSK